MRDYELVFIIAPEVEDDDLDGVIEKVNQMITTGGGQVNSVKRWGRRHLAYPIRKKNEGYYVVMQTQLQPDTMPALERSLKLTEEVMRYLLVRTGT